MHISLDNINFYSQPPPAKPPPHAFPVSRWKPYQTLAPPALSHALLPRPPSPGTPSTLASVARPDASPRIRAPVREDSGLRTVRNEFDIEIESIAMAENERVAHEATNLDMHPDSGIRNENVTDMAQSQHTSSATEHADKWMCPLAEAVSDSDPAFTPAESDLHHSGPPAGPTDRMGLHRDSTPSLGTCKEIDEIDKDPTPPEVTFTSACISPSPSPDLLGSVRQPQARPGAEVIMRDESVVDNTKSASESREDREGDYGDVVATIEGVQADSPSVREASPDDNERNKSSEESQASRPSCFRPRSRLIRQSEVPLTSTSSLRPRPSAGSTQPERFPSVSVVIPTRRTDALVTSTKTKPLTGTRRYGHWGGSGRGNPNEDRATQALMRDYSPSSPKARDRPRKRPKRVMENNSASTNNIDGGFTCQSQNQSNDGLAVTLGKTQEFFGRGVLRIQSHGPRDAYFMTFLPEVTQRPSPPSPSEMPPHQSSCADDTSENESLHPVIRGRRHKRTVRTVCEDEDAWSTRHSAKQPRNVRSRNGRNEARRKPRRRLPWSSDEADFLLKLRRDEDRPWSEVAKLFSDRYPGRSPGSIQVYWSTTLKKARQNRIMPAAT